MRCQRHGVDMGKVGYNRQGGVRYRCYLCKKERLERMDREINLERLAMPIKIGRGLKW